MFARDVSVDESVSAFELGSHRSEARRGVSKYEANDRRFEGVPRPTDGEMITELRVERNRRRGETHRPWGGIEAPPSAPARPLWRRYPAGAPCPPDAIPDG